MAKSGLKHIDVGPELTKTEWESQETHELIHGTSFPSSPVERQLFYRDDEHKWYIYNGTSWVWLGGGGGGSGDMLKSVYDTNDNSIVDNAEKLEGSTKAQVQDHTPKAHTLASHSSKAHSELTGVGADDHHVKYTDAEAKAQAQGAKLDDHAAPDDNTDLDATTLKHGLMPKADKSKLDGIAAGADVTGSNPPQAHKASHQDGGSDEISIAGLDGSPAQKGTASGLASLDAQSRVVQSAKTLKDADSDTGIQVEESADEDIIRMDVAGVEAFLLSDAGILTLVKQSACYAWANAAQVIPESGTSQPRIVLDQEVSDHQNEFDSTLKTGTADGNVLNHLQDDTSSQFTADDVGAWVLNTTDNTYGKVTAFNDAGDVTLDGDTFPDGNENYKLYRAKYTVTEDGTYLIIGNIRWKSGLVIDQVYYGSIIRKNGSQLSQAGTAASGTAAMNSLCIAVTQLSANDIITLAVTNASGGASATLDGGNNWRTFFVVAKLY